MKSLLVKFGSNKILLIVLIIASIPLTMVCCPPLFLFLLYKPYQYSSVDNFICVITSFIWIITTFAASLDYYFHDKTFERGYTSFKNPTMIILSNYIHISGASFIVSLFLYIIVIFILLPFAYGIGSLSSMFPQFRWMLTDILSTFSPISFQVIFMTLIHFLFMSASNTEIKSIEVRQKTNNKRTKSQKKTNNISNKKYEFNEDKDIEENFSGTSENIKKSSNDIRELESKYKAVSKKYPKRYNSNDIVNIANEITSLIFAIFDHPPTDDLYSEIVIEYTIFLSLYIEENALGRIIIFDISRELSEISCFKNKKDHILENFSEIYYEKIKLYLNYSFNNRTIDTFLSRKAKRMAKKFNNDDFSKQAQCLNASKDILIKYGIIQS